MAMRSQSELEVKFFDTTHLWEVIHALDTLKSDHEDAEVTRLDLDGEELTIALEWKSE